MAHYNKCVIDGCKNFAGSLGKGRKHKHVCRGCCAMLARARKAGDTGAEHMTRLELEDKYWNLREKSQQDESP